MSLVQVNWHPTRDELRTFGFISLAAFGLIGAWVFLRHSVFGLEISPAAAQATAYACWSLAIGSLVASVIAPGTLKPLYLCLTAISLPIGFVVSHVLMAVVYYGLLTPTGLVFRMIGRDALQRRVDPSARSYWQRRQVVRDRAQYFKQY